MSVTRDMQWIVCLDEVPVGARYEFRVVAELAHQEEQRAAERLGLGAEFAARSEVLPRWEITITLSPGIVGERPTRAEIIEAVLAELNAWPPDAEIEDAPDSFTMTGSEAHR